MRMRLIAVVLLGLAAAPAAAQEAARCGGLPPAVAQTRDAIRAAAAAGDIDGLAALAGHDGSTTSFGDVEDLAAWWRSLKAEGQDVAAIILALLDMPCAASTGEEGMSYGWPSAADLPYDELTANEKAALQKLYDGRLEEQYLEGPETGYYIGWRLYIEEDGRWSAFVAGD